MGRKGAGCGPARKGGSVGSAGREVLLEPRLNLPLAGAERSGVHVAEGEESLGVHGQGLLVAQFTERKQQVEAVDLRVRVLRPEQADPGVEGLIAEQRACRGEA